MLPRVGFMKIGTATMFREHKQISTNNLHTLADMGDICIIPDIFCGVNEIFPIMGCYTAQIGSY